MNPDDKSSFLELKNILSKEQTILNQINQLIEESERGNTQASSKVSPFIQNLDKENAGFYEALDKINLVKPLPSEIGEAELEKEEFTKKDYNLKGIREDFAKLSEKKVRLFRKEKLPSPYISVSNRMFANSALSVIRHGYFKFLDKDLKKANINLLLKSYVSVIFFTSFMAFLFALVLEPFLFFFEFSFNFPFVFPTEKTILERFTSTFWIIIVFPILAYVVMYFYPKLERKSIEKRMNNELPFVVINMAAMSSSLVDPTKIFNVMVSTKEYPLIEKEFIKIINGVNILGYNLITILRKRAENVPSVKLSDLFNGIATNINSGGDLPKFFGERSESLLFDYNLEREQEIRSSETFMDIYISIVVAAPMILMLLLVILQISGIGITLSISMITLIIVSIVSLLNIFFILFLRLRKSA
jgi:hypothetical protein|tara:strand:+ start:545 stop:1792 length:1248 start_codon:yes stop_codon:yes gene_type:complete